MTSIVLKKPVDCIGVDSRTARVLRKAFDRYANDRKRGDKELAHLLSKSIGIKYQDSPAFSK